MAISKPIAIAISMLIATTTLTGCAMSEPTDPNLLWSQEFDGEAGSALDPTYWTAEIGDGGSKGIPGWGNSERQYYLEEAARTDGEGNLVITATKMPVYSKDNPDGMPTEENPYLCYYLTACEWTSARVITEKKISFMYGRMETRIKMGGGQGAWPAFWMLGTNIEQVGWPQSGEIDIIESLGRDPMTAYATLHGPGYFAGQGYGATSARPDALADDFHVYAINWKPDYIEWEIDGEVFHTATPEDVAPNEWVYNQPFYLLMNLAMGGGFGGNIDPKLEFSQMSVDYIRYSKYEGFGEISETSE